MCTQAEDGEQSAAAGSPSPTASSTTDPIIDGVPMETSAADQFFGEVPSGFEYSSTMPPSSPGIESLLSNGSAVVENCDRQALITTGSIAELSPQEICLDSEGINAMGAQSFVPPGQLNTFQMAPAADRDFDTDATVQTSLSSVSDEAPASAAAAPWPQPSQAPEEYPPEALQAEWGVPAAAGPAAVTNPTLDAERRERRRLSARRINARGQAARKVLGEQGEAAAAKLLRASVNSTGGGVDSWDMVMESALGILPDRFLAMEGARRALQTMLSDMKRNKNVRLRRIALEASDGGGGYSAGGPPEGPPDGGDGLLPDQADAFPWGW